MSNRGAIIRFCASALCVALFFTYISVKGLSVSVNIYIQTQAPVLDNTDPSQTVSEQSVLTQAQSQSQSTSNSAPTNSQAVKVSATGTVQGKIIEKFISPYTANTSYDNVYLKNNTSLNINLKDFTNGNLGY